jgi:hypothetical protein
MANFRHQKTSLREVPLFYLFSVRKIKVVVFWPFFFFWLFLETFELSIAALL